jgi:hypothetical protein
MQCDKIKNYDSLIDEIKKGIRRVIKNDLVRSVENWSHRVLTILKYKDAFIK